MTGRRILIVDDEAQILNVLRKILTTAGYEVDTALNAASALELLSNNTYAAALVDCNLPDMNGVRLHRKIGQIEPELAQRTIFMSGQVRAQGHKSYYVAEAAGFLPKPLDVGAVVVLISALTGAAPLHEKVPTHRWQAV